MNRHRFVAIALALAASASYGNNNCVSIRANIEAKIRASGAKTFTLSTVPADAPVTGKVVGTCDRGSEKIVYTQDSPTPLVQPRAAPHEERIITECKDGSVTVGGSCKK